MGTARYECDPALHLLKRFGKQHVKASAMTLHIQLIPLLSIITGILILVKPRLLNYLVAIYLILIGVIQLFSLHI